MSRTKYSCIVISKLRKMFVQYIMRGQFNKHKDNKRKNIFFKELFYISKCITQSNECILRYKRFSTQVKSIFVQNTSVTTKQLLNKPTKTKCKTELHQQSDKTIVHFK